jgi:hypothetical protein
VAAPAAYRPRTSVAALRQAEYEACLRSGAREWSPGRWRQQAVPYVGCAQERRLTPRSRGDPARQATLAPRRAVASSIVLRGARASCLTGRLSSNVRQQKRRPCTAQQEVRLRREPEQPRGGKAAQDRRRAGQAEPVPEGSDCHQLWPSATGSLRLRKEGMRLRRVERRSFESGQDRHRARSLALTRPSSRTIGRSLAGTRCSPEAGTVKVGGSSGGVPPLLSTRRATGPGVS